MKHFSLPKDGGLLEKSVPSDVLHAYDKIFTDVYESAEKGSEVVADKIIAAISNNQGGLFRIGLATGSTPITLYRILSRKCAEGLVSFRNVEIFSIDEYYPISSDSAQSRNVRLHKELLENIDVLDENVHIPDGSMEASKVTDYCAKFDLAARFGHQGCHPPFGSPWCRYVLRPS